MARKEQQGDKTDPLSASTTLFFFISFLLQTEFFLLVLVQTSFRFPSAERELLADRGIKSVLRGAEQGGGVGLEEAKGLRFLEVQGRCEVWGAACLRSFKRR